MMMRNRKLHPRPGDEHPAGSANAQPSDRPWGVTPDKPPVYECEEGNQLAQAIIDIAQPVLTRSRSLTEMEAIVTVAVQVWNMSLLPAAKQEQFLIELIRSFDFTPDQAKTLETLVNDIETMARRREDLHAGNRRIIVEYGVARRDGHLVLNVIGTATASQDEAA